MNDFLFGALIGIGSLYISNLVFEVYERLRAMAKKDKPTEPLLTKEQEKQLDRMATIGFGVYKMWHKLPLYQAKKDATRSLSNRVGYFGPSRKHSWANW